MNIKIKRMYELISVLNQACEMYYKHDNPSMSDKQFDTFMDELENLERETGIIMHNSPTQKVNGEVLDSLQKVKHSKPMLSANKTKDINEIKKFIGNHKVVVSWKLDGLTIVVRYKNGKFYQAITRGSGGIVGEDVTHTLKMASNLPMKLPFYCDLEVRGECVISWKDFNKINETLQKPYRHPRSLASGSVRQLDSNIAKERNLIFIAFELVETDRGKNSDQDFMNIMETFDYLTQCGFEVVEHHLVSQNKVDKIIKLMNPELYKYPVDGLIWKYNDIDYGLSLGETSKFPLNMLALKWKDETETTTLRNIEWNTSKTGLVNPIAIFDPVILDGTTVERASLHNVSIIKQLKLGIGDEIEVYKANLIIPQIDKNHTESNTYQLPKKCPCCSEELEQWCENDSITLHCVNERCPAQLISKLSHFTSRDAMDIVGLSESTIQKLVKAVKLQRFIDIYKLHKYKEKLIHIEGLGERSVNKLLSQIEESKNVTLDRFLYAISLPLVGKSTSKILANHAKTYREFVQRVMNNYMWNCIDDIGELTSNEINKYCQNHMEEIDELASIMNFQYSKESEKIKTLMGKTYCITGSLNTMSRKELIDKIEKLGGKVSGSISATTSYLINNDTESNSNKNIKAKKLGIPIVSELDFLKIIGE